MANKTLVIVVSTPRATADVTDLIKSSTVPRDEMNALSLYFKRLAEGCDKGVGNTVYVSYSTSAPVHASGTITLTYASISNADTLTLGGSVLTCVTGTPSTNEFKKQTDAGTTAANLVALINSHSTLSKLVVASRSSGVVTLTAIPFGAIGNQFSMATSNGTGFALSPASALGSGAGGAEVAHVSYSRG